MSTYIYTIKGGMSFGNVFFQLLERNVFFEGGEAKRGGHRIYPQRLATQRRLGLGSLIFTGIEEKGQTLRFLDVKKYPPPLKINSSPHEKGPFLKEIIIYHHLPTINFQRIC